MTLTKTTECSVNSSFGRLKNTHSRLLVDYKRTSPNVIDEILLTKGWKECMSDSSMPKISIQTVI